MLQFYKWACRAVCKAYKTRLVYSVIIRISAQTTTFIITKVLEYKAEELNLYALLICSLVMSLCSYDLHVTSLKTMNSSRLTVVQLTQSLVFRW